MCVTSLISKAALVKKEKDANLLPWVYWFLFIFNVSFSSIRCAALYMGRCCIGIHKASYFVVYCNQLQVMARRSDRLRSRDPEIVEMEFECFFCKLEGFTCQTNVLRLSCCSNFCHKKCQEVWKKTWSHCGRRKQAYPNWKVQRPKKTPRDAKKSTQRRTRLRGTYVIHAPRIFRDNARIFSVWEHFTFQTKNGLIMCPFATWF